MKNDNKSIYGNAQFPKTKKGVRCYPKFQS